MTGQSKKVLVHLDMGGNQLISAVVENVAGTTKPTVGSVGQLIYQGGSLWYCTSASSGSTSASWTQLAAGSAGTMNYNDLNNKPQINSVTLTGNKSTSDIIGYTPEDAGNKVTSIGTPSSGSVKYPTDYAVITAINSAISSLPTPMQFKGSVGIGGTKTWDNLPAASASNGHVYKVITAHSTTPVCKIGDTIISNGSEWVVIPSGDEPSGTVTSVGTGTGLTGGPITSSGTISIDTSVVQTVGNIVTSISSSSTDTKYPSAKAVYTFVNNSVPKEASLTISTDAWAYNSTLGCYYVTVEHGLGVLPKSVELYDALNIKVITAMGVTANDITVFANISPNTPYTLKVIS